MSSDRTKRDADALEMALVAMDVLFHSLPEASRPRARMEFLAVVEDGHRRGGKRVPRWIAKTRSHLKESS